MVSEVVFQGDGKTLRIAIIQKIIILIGITRTDFFAGGSENIIKIKTDFPLFIKKLFIHNDVSGGRASDFQIPLHGSGMKKMPNLYIPVRFFVESNAGGNIGI